MKDGIFYTHFNQMFWERKHLVDFFQLSLCSFYIWSIIHIYEMISIIITIINNWPNPGKAGNSNRNQAIYFSFVKLNIEYAMNGKYRYEYVLNERIMAKLKCHQKSLTNWKNNTHGEWKIKYTGDKDASKNNMSSYLSIREYVVYLYNCVIMNGLRFAVKRIGRS